MPRIGVNGIELYYDLTGPENAPVLVLSNGIMMGTASWVYQKTALNTHLRVLLYDCRGMWQSDHPRGALFDGTACGRLSRLAGCVAD